MDQEAVEYEIREGLAILRLTRPERRNALTAEVKSALARRIFDFFRDPEARCLLITGSGGVFCAGGDLTGLDAGHTPAQSRARLEGSYSWVRELLRGEKPVITAVQGAAAGAGFGLALLGDIILAAEDAVFTPAFPAVGVAADLLLSRSLARAVGAPRAKEILLTNRRIDGRQAEAIGLVSRALPASELEPSAIELGLLLAQGPTLALGLTKRLVDRSYELSDEAFIDAELGAQTRAFASMDCIEGVSAFFEKRSAVFRGC